MEQDHGSKVQVSRADMAVCMLDLITSARATHRGRLRQRGGGGQRQEGSRGRHKLLGTRVEAEGLGVGVKTKITNFLLFLIQLT